MPGSARGDSYLKRLAGAAVVAVVLAIVAASLSPRSDPDREWFEHIALEGELRILDAIEVIDSDDPVDTEAARRMEGATQGVPSPITDRVVNEDNPDPVALERPEGTTSTTPDVHRIVDPEVLAALQDDAYVEMNRAAQLSDQFVLLHSVQPRYPEGVPPAVRQREVVVRVNIYVDETGHVTHSYVDRNEGGPRFEAAVLEAVTQWIYRPLIVDGEAEGFWDTIYFVFRVGPGGKISLEELRRG